MYKIYIVGNPNSGKTTLFNSLTKSSEHVGNWHGVTVDKKSKVVKFEDEEYELVDLPGIYSLNAFSLEEDVSVDVINSKNCKQILYLIDANNFKRSMLLALTLLTQNKNIKILINNYQYFAKCGGSIDIEYLHKILGCEIEIIDARKIKPSKQLLNFITHETAFIKTLKNEINLNNEAICDNENEVKNTEKINRLNENVNLTFDCDKCDINENNLEKINNINNCKNHTNIKNKLNNKLKNINILYKYILKIANNCVKIENKIYGYSKFDNKLLKLSVFLPVFILLIFGVIFITFFLVGPFISDVFLKVLYYLIQKPLMAIISVSNSKFIIVFFEEGVFGACFSVMGFLPQICLMYLFLSMLENSGLITRMAFLLDDFLQRVGLNGKIVYTMLMGFGCSTSATLTAKNMTDKNSQVKAGLLTPFISCSAKLPIYTLVATAICGVKSVWVVLGLYMLGIVMAVVLSAILSKTILPTKDEQFLIEFPPLKSPDINNICVSVKSSCKQFVVKVFGVIFGASVILWLLNNINIKFEYVGESGKSILYSFSSIISWMFKPIGLDNPNIICALLIGLVAKELILSSFAISNKVTNLASLSASLTFASSAVNFNLASGMSFLVFTLLYFPCVSNFGVLLKEVGLKYTLLGVGMQLISAYLISYIVYTLLTQGVVQVLISLVVFVVFVLSLKILLKRFKSKKLFCNCLSCDRCNK